LKLTFIYQPIEDLREAVAFYRDRLGFEEAWREGDDTVAFWIPDRSVQIMVTTEKTGPVGPMYLVGDVDAWISDHPDVVVTVAPVTIPGGSVAGFAAPGGHTFYVFDQPGA
jgi:catechol 2,3-dioxygenase-like lactoylglutathione lyase family enzyme